MKKFWIKERHNPQTGIYYVACGQLTKNDARKNEKSLYGENIMHPFDTEEDYKKKISELQKSGERIV